MQQLQLFEQQTFYITRDLKEALHLSAKMCGLSRDEIVDGMNRLATRYGVALVKGNGRGNLTRETLEKWLNPEDATRQIPVKALPIFCAVTKDVSPMEVMVRPLGCTVVDPDRQKKLAWAAAKLAATAAQAKIRKLEAEIC